MDEIMSKSPLSVAVLMGGPSAEAEVSRNSAAQVAKALAQKGHEHILIELNRDAAERLVEFKPDVVFPALHGPPGEDGTVQGFLEILQYPYVGSGVRGSALAMDKGIAKRIFRQNGLPVLDDYIVNPSDNVTMVAEDIKGRLGREVVIKPLNQGSAIGVMPLPNGGDIARGLSESLKFGPCLVEPFFTGKEITVGILEIEGQSLAHPAIEIRTSDNEWYDYKNRYAPGQSEHIIPAHLENDVQKQLQKIAGTAHQILGLRDLSRADFIVANNNEIALLEVNTLPGMTPTSLYPDGAQHLGYGFAELIDLLVRQAALR